MWGRVSNMTVQQAGLAAPTLCPRCDAAAPAANGDRPAERCEACSLPLGWCGNCQGVAGPFDRFCGFCGFELIRGEPRSQLWRLGAAAAAIVLASGLVYGLWAAGVPGALRGASRSLSGATSAQGKLAATGSYDRTLGIRYSAPENWVTTVEPAAANSQEFIVLARTPDDRDAAIGARGDLTKLYQIESSVITLGRPDLGTQIVEEARDPVAALTAQVAPLVAAPPAGLVADVIEPVHGTRVGGRSAAVVLLKLTRGHSVTYLRRALVYAPHTGVRPILQTDALAPTSEWPAVDVSAVASVTRSLSFG